MGWKGELFGCSVVSYPTTFNNFILPIIAWAFEYMMVCAVPILVAAQARELGPEIFAGTMVWRLFTNGRIIYVALGELGEKHYLGWRQGWRATGSV